MSVATIVLEDVDGAIAVKATFGEGFDANSHAHQHAQILIGFMDQLCSKQGEPEVVAADVQEAPLIVVAEG